MVDDERHLVVLMEGRQAGLIAMDRAGRFTLRYGEAWRGERNATPLSLSMPIARRDHQDAPVRAFLWGLLPDNERVLDRWAQTYQVSARNPFGLLSHVGEDCAGAVQLVKPSRLDAVLAGEGSVDWLTEEDVADRLRVLRRDPTAWHVYNTGQFSLAGAQAKTALCWDRETSCWGVPSGSAATTHILKPAVLGLDDHDLNEHLCLEAARLLGLSAASSEVRSFGSERAIVVTRYDRLRLADGSIVRIHQEDMCQALAIMPTLKYQNEGGPSPEQIIAVLRDRIVQPAAAAEAVTRFFDALAFNWIIGGTDAHAKNFSVLLRGGQVRLSPAYDVASVLPYAEMYVPRLKMAMRVGGEYGLHAVSGHHWRRFASANGLSPDSVMGRLDDLVSRVPDAFATAAAADPVKELGATLPARLVDQIANRAADCRRSLER
jgi:serine/threonine-protein kinase HipA